MEAIIKEIERKKAELLKLNKKLDDAGKAKYNFLIGKCYSLAATCKIKVINIMSIDERYNSINIECIRIQGGKHDKGRIEVDINGDYDLSFCDIDEKCITEISQEKFMEFLFEALEETRKTLENI
jgi:hypothetical protein